MKLLLLCPYSCKCGSNHTEIALADDIFLAKKSKSQHLARKDWEMLEHYVAGQWDQPECAQATISPQPEQDTLDPQSSEPKTGMQATGEVIPVTASTSLPLDESK
jgi:hypothetical protein